MAKIANNPARARAEARSAAIDILEWMGKLRRGLHTDNIVQISVTFIEKGAPDSIILDVAKELDRDDSNANTGHSGPSSQRQPKG